jgi:hypothetical protein
MRMRRLPGLSQARMGSVRSHFTPMLRITDGPRDGWSCAVSILGAGNAPPFWSMVEGWNTTAYSLASWNELYGA